MSQSILDSKFTLSSVNWFAGYLINPRTNSTLSIYFLAYYTIAKPYYEVNSAV